MLNRKTAMAVIILALLVLPLMQISVSEESSAAGSVVVADKGDATITVNAGTSTSFDVIVTNTAPYDEESTADDVIFTMTAKAMDMNGNGLSGVTVSVAIKDGSSNYVILSGQRTAVFTVSVSSERFINSGSYHLAYTYSIADIAGTQIGSPVTVAKNLDVKMYNSGEGYYNKFLGVFQNTLDGIFGQSWFTALVSLLAILGIGVVVSFIAAPLASAIITKKADSDRKTLRKSLVKLFMMLFIIFGISRSLAVFGIDSEEYTIIDDVFLVTYAIVGAYIIWKIYAAVLDHISDDLEARGNKDALENYRSFKPLFLYLGKIIIALVALFSVMGTLGFDLTAIITSAGLITLGITFGAQQVLSQFFAGLQILATRPFKKDDILELNDKVYRVRKVTVMNTELVNWDNSDVTIVPNNTLTSTSVKNLTRDTLRTKLYIYVGLAYGTDVEKAQNLMVDAAKENEHVINDGTSPAPSSSLEEFSDSTLQMRLDVWIDDYNNYIDISSEIRKAMFNKFNAADIVIDYPQIVIHRAD